MSRDPELFPSPLTFDSRRHIHLLQSLDLGTTTSAKVDSMPLEKREAERIARIRGLNPQYPFWAFGGGRRACPGNHLADREITFTLAKLLMVLQFLPPKATTGIDEDTFSLRFNLHPVNYKMRVVKRV
jgi:cytochrome P450